MVESKTPGLLPMPRTPSNSDRGYSPMRQSVWHPSKLSHTSRHRSSSLKNAMNLRSMSWDSKTVRRCEQSQTVKVEADRRNYSWLKQLEDYAASNTGWRVPLNVCRWVELLDWENNILGVSLSRIWVQCTLLPWRIVGSFQMYIKCYEKNETKKKEIQRGE